MIILGLTGSIAMGKSTTADMFRAAGVPVYDADKTVHELYARGGAAVGPVGALVPAVIKDQAVDRAALKAALKARPELLSQIETIVHPLTAHARKQFLQHNVSAPLVVLDIPLLFETGLDNQANAVLVVTAPEDVQMQRIRARGSLDARLLKSILDKQLPDVQKRARADFIIDTSQGLEHARREVEAIIAYLTSGEA